MFDIIIQCAFIFLATIGFSILFNVKKDELLYCGIVGVVCFFFYDVFILNNLSSFLGALIGTFIAVVISRRLAFTRKIPAAIYIIPAIIPIVPGAAIYLTIYNIISENNYAAIYYAFETMKITGGIVIGMSIALSLPSSWFNNIKEKR